jgi:hypothetical protein
MLTYKQKREYLLTVIFQARGLSSSEKLVALCLAFNIDDSGRSTLKMNQLSQMSRLHLRHVRKMVRVLENKIDLKVRQGGRGNTYYFPQWAEL